MIVLEFHLISDASYEELSSDDILFRKPKCKSDK